MLIVFFYKSPEHIVVVGRRLRVAIPGKEEETAVTVHCDGSRAPAAQHTLNAAYTSPFIGIRRILLCVLGLLI